jgi:hypothetical protein
MGTREGLTVSSVEPEQYANERYGGKECVGELVVADPQGAGLLELAEEALDGIALATQGEIGLALRASSVVISASVS